MTGITGRIADPQAPFKERFRDLCGYVQNATDVRVEVSQDDATGTWFVRVGRNSYSGDTMDDAFEKAFQDPINNPFT